MLRSSIYYDQNIELDEDKTKSTQTCVILVIDCKLDFSESPTPIMCQR